ncbi:hypothetical protein acsn021_06650 [Anaerocolumna cellulosilytica]|uniref:Uncharacterized protein n=2 Tax=Anaerocolumna cellulosilytica TaxID=433286 RepID=A0A6S6QTU1_9FIRM|nr:hypothetical protein acsn021_06650 [Anaerocolumna cellulosilytica]
MLSTYYIQMDSVQKEYDTARLNQCLKYSTEAAFLSVFSRDNLSIKYQEMNDLKLEPGSSLDTFKDMICLNYGMAVNEENREYIENCISVAMLASSDGYYVTELTEINSTNGLNGDVYGLVWSSKLPYTLDIEIGIVGLNLVNEKWSKVTKSGSSIVVKEGDRYTDLEVSAYINHNIKKRRINSLLTDALTFQVNAASELRGEVDYNFYLPPVQTFSGINDISNTSLIILLGNADFSGRAVSNNVTIAGLSAIRKIRVICYEEDGRKYYCYETQIPQDSFGLIKMYYDTAMEAAKAGYAPDYRYIFNKQTLSIDK